MKVLVLGSNGMAGHMVSLYLKERGHEVFGLARRKSEFVETIIGDVTDFDSLERIIAGGDFKFDYVINCIGILNKQAEDNKEYAVLINSLLPHHLAKLTENLKTKVIHISTDCIFSGSTGEYEEDSLPDARTFYGRSKALGELNDDKNLTIRTSIIGPDINENGIGLFNWFMKQSGEINGYAKVIWTGITTLELAKVIESAMSQNVSGLVNMVNNETISKYDLLKTIAEKFEKEIVINKTEDYVSNKSLKRTNLEFDYTVPSYEQMIEEMKEWVITHKNLYKNY